MLWSVYINDKEKELRQKFYNEYLWSIFKNNDEDK